MLRIHLLDPEGRPRLVFNQPEKVSDPTAISAWLSVFAAAGTLRDGESMEVKFPMDRGTMAIALITNKSRRLEITHYGELIMLLTAQDIIPDPVSFI